MKLDSCFTHQFKIIYSETQPVVLEGYHLGPNLVGSNFVSSNQISAGGHLWRFQCYPHGSGKSDGEYVSIYLARVNESKEDVKAIFEAFVVDREGAPSSTHRKRAVYVYKPRESQANASGTGWRKFVKRSVLKSLYVSNGSFTIMCGAKIVRDEPLDVPPSDIGSHLRLMLDSGDGADVSFSVGGETFLAHRLVLAARSPVFKAQLLGSMADANMSSITMHDIAPKTFKIMLWFMYTDACPADAELGDSPLNVFRDLLIAADRFALDRLKILCAKRLWDSVTVDTIADTLAYAETYNCPELKKKCFDFLGEDKNFKKAAITEGFSHLVQNFPTVIVELRDKVIGA
ncbi:hypothetical protein BS78_07G196400 [Paspalum vaginatum]|nr:hypothetical protein BS78_07G196400 [Paspalum vaginatum]